MIYNGEKEQIKSNILYTRKETISNITMIYHDVISFK